MGYNGNMRQINTVMIPAHDIHDQLMAQVIILLHQLKKHVEDEMRGPRMDKEDKSQIPMQNNTGHVWPRGPLLPGDLLYICASKPSSLKNLAGHGGSPLSRISTQLTAGHDCGAFLYRTDTVGVPAPYGRTQRWASCQKGDQGVPLTGLWSSSFPEFPLEWMASSSM